MKIGAEILRRLAALNLPAEAMAGVLSILADIQGADDARLKNQRERTARSRHKKSDGNVTVTSEQRDKQRDIPPQTPLKEERKIPEANASGASGPTQAELERELFRRGRQICGKASGGLIASLLKAKQHDVALARSVIELAATKHDPRQYLAAAIKGENHASNRQNSSGNRGQGFSAYALECAREAAGYEQATDDS